MEVLYPGTIIFDASGSFGFSITKITAFAFEDNDNYDDSDEIEELASTTSNVLTLKVAGDTIISFIIKVIKIMFIATTDCTTDAPLSPTTEPTMEPTMNQYIPSNDPTVNPTMDPTSYPSNSPTTPSPTDPGELICGDISSGDFNDTNDI